MFNPHAEPIANAAPYKRIAIGQSEPQPGEPNIALTSDEILRDAFHQCEARRIWALVQESASGVNPPTYEAPAEDAA